MRKIVVEEELTWLRIATNRSPVAKKPPQDLIPGETRFVLVESIQELLFPVRYQSHVGAEPLPQDVELRRIEEKPILVDDFFD